MIKNFCIAVLLFGVTWNVSAQVLTSSERARTYEMLDILNKQIDAIDDRGQKKYVLEQMIENLQIWASGEQRILSQKGKKIVEELSKFICLKSEDITGFVCLENIFMVDTTYDMDDSQAQYDYIPGKRLYIQIQNQIRIDHDVSLLSENTTLMNVAQLYADELCETDHFGHVGLSGSTTQSRIDASSYPYQSIGENLAEGYTNSELTLLQLWASESHRKTLFNQKYREVGVGYCDKKWVVLYGTPQ